MATMLCTMVPRRSVLPMQQRRYSLPVMRAIALPSHGRPRRLGASRSAPRRHAGAAAARDDAALLNAQPQDLEQHQAESTSQGDALPVESASSLDGDELPSPHEAAAAAMLSEQAAAALSDGGNLLDSMSSSQEEETFETDAGLVEPVEEEDAEVDLFGESTLGNLHFAEENVTAPVDDVGDLLGLSTAGDVLSLPYAALRERVQSLLGELGVPQTTYPAAKPQRAIYCSRTLNLRSIVAIGYDMDYTLIDYDVDQWEGKAYAYGLQALREMGCPVDGLTFDTEIIIRGLILDTELGNIVKADRFGFVKRAMHGTRMMTAAEVRSAYGRELINLRNEGRWVFLNTLFSMSEACLYAQLVDRLDEGSIASQVCPPSYRALYKLVAKALFRAHVEGKLKAEIIQDPRRYVHLDPDMAQTLLDQRQAGKALLLITNSDLEYTSRMMSFAYDRFLPDGMKWRDLFDVTIVNARKPDFFNHTMSLYEVVTEEGLMRPTYALKRGGLYCGGSASLVEKALGVSGDDILYIGDHIYTDAAMAKLNFRWRTALVLRELEQEIEALARGRRHRELLKELLNKKEVVGDLFNNLRLARQRALNDSTMVPPSSGRQAGPVAWNQEEQEVNEILGELITVMETLDDAIGPMVEQDGRHFNKRWGYLCRSGVNDRSQLMRQIEKYADVFTSRVSNFLRYTPYMYFRSPAQSLAHDRPSSDTLVLSVDSPLAGSPANGAISHLTRSTSDE